MRKISFFVAIIYLAIGLQACKHNEPAPVTQAVPVWQLHPDLQFANKLLLSADAGENRLIVAGTQGFVQLNAGDSTFLDGNNLTIFSAAYDTDPTFYPPIISNNLYVSLNGERSLIELGAIGKTRGETKQLSSNSSTLLTSSLDPIPPNDIISSSTVWSPGGRVNAFGAFNSTTNTLLLHSSRGVILLTPKDGNNSFAVRGYTSSNYRVAYVPTQESVGGRTLTSISVGNHFIVRMAGTGDYASYYLVAVYPDGTVKKISFDQANQTLRLPDAFFQYKNNLYGWNTTTGWLAVSTDGGFTWQSKAQVNFGGELVKFQEINGKLTAFASAGSQIFLIDDGSQTFNYYDKQTGNLYELNTSGLTGNEITGLAAFGKKVYASTLSGLYQINSRDFFTLKPAVK